MCQLKAPRHPPATQRCVMTATQRAPPRCLRARQRASLVASVCDPHSSSRASGPAPLARSARLLRAHERFVLLRVGDDVQRPRAVLQARYESGRRLHRDGGDVLGARSRAPGAHRRHAVLRRSLLHPLPPGVLARLGGGARSVRARLARRWVRHALDTADGWSPRRPTHCRPRVRVRCPRPPRHPLQRLRRSRSCFTASETRREWILGDSPRRICVLRR